MNKASQRELAKLYKLPLTTINRLGKNGVNLESPKEVKERVLSQSKRPKGWENGCPWEMEEKPKQEQVIDQDENQKRIELNLDEITKLENQLLQKPDYTESRNIRTIITSLKESVQLRQLMGQYLLRLDVLESMQRITHVLSACANRLPNDLPAILEGLPASKMKPLVQEKVTELLNSWADEVAALTEEEN